MSLHLCTGTLACDLFQTSNVVDRRLSPNQARFWLDWVEKPSPGPRRSRVNNPRVGHRAARPTLFSIVCVPAGDYQYHLVRSAAEGVVRGPDVSRTSKGLL